jgi:predicted DNA-binding protein
MLKQTAFRVSEKDLKELEVIAKRDDRSVAYLLRKIIRKFLDEQSRGK